MIKKLVLSALLFITTVSAQPIIIDLFTLKAADGTMFTAKDIVIIRQFKKFLMQILLGEKKDGKLIGPYVFDNEPHSIATLAKLERTKQLSDDERNKLLTYVRAHFQENTQEFKKHSEGTKTQQYLYIKESCRLHGRLNSILLLWAEAPEGQEDDAIDQYIHTFEDMKSFVYDLNNFLDDMLSSVPNARAEYLNNVHDYQERQKIATYFDRIAQKQFDKINKIKNS